MPRRGRNKNTPSTSSESSFDENSNSMPASTKSNPLPSHVYQSISEEENNNALNGKALRSTKKMMRKKYQPPVRRARPRPRKGRPKKQLKINGLDLLHNQTLLSTSPQGLHNFFLSTDECSLVRF